MKQLDERLDNNPTKSEVRQMAELRIRNLQAFAELQSLNDTGKFLYTHPLVACKSERATLEQLFRCNPGEFLRKHKNCLDNIRRYSAYIKRPERLDKRKSDKEHLAVYRQQELLFQSIIESKNKE